MGSILLLIWWKPKRGFWPGRSHYVLTLEPEAEKCSLLSSAHLKVSTRNDICPNERGTWWSACQSRVKCWVTGLNCVSAQEDFSKLWKIKETFLPPLLHQLPCQEGVRAMVKTVRQQMFYLCVFSILTSFLRELQQPQVLMILESSALFAPCHIPTSWPHDNAYALNRCDWLWEAWNKIGQLIYSRLVFTGLEAGGLWVQWTG